jgi:poly-gamma-glutamate synthesis protein (capsule biosynthesis protein)
MAEPSDRTVTLFLCGDVMTGRGIDQIMAHPCPPHLFEPYVDSAADYVRMAEAAHGPIPAPVDPAYVWGEALGELDRQRPDLRIVNLETAVTRSEDAEPKGINYRMSPENAGCLTAAGIDCCILANNHVLDWGVAGLEETLDALHGRGIATAGAGRSRAEAEAPAVLPVPGRGRVLVYAVAHGSSGVPGAWAARGGRPGVAVLPELSADAARALARRTAADRRPGDVVVVSVHWGPNWGYGVPRSEREFARALVDEAGADAVYGHSSHHPKGGEVRDGKPILYGCGDFLTDYEGIRGYEEFRGDLGLMYLPALSPADGRLAGLEMVPFRVRNFRLNRPDAQELAWLARMLDREYHRLGGRVEDAGPGRFRLAL